MRILTYITTEADAGRAARSVVPRRFQLGTHAFRRLKVEGGILCDGAPLRADTVLRAGQRLEIRMDNGETEAKRNAPTCEGGGEESTVGFGLDQPNRFASGLPLSATVKGRLLGL